MQVWQLDKIRRGLLSYRALKSVNGKPYPWVKILADIPASSGPDLKEESLRRFAVGINKAFEPIEKIDDVVEFLIRAKVLARKELDLIWGDFNEAVLVHDKLANITYGAADKHQALATSYRAEGTVAEGEEIRLEFAVEPPGTLIWVEEKYHFSDDSPNHMPNYYRKDGSEYQTIIRRGYGFCISDLPNMNFFVRGADRSDLIHYVRVYPREGPIDDDSLYLLRYGDERPSGAVNFSGSDFHAALRNLNIFRFVSVTSNTISSSNNKNITPLAAAKAKSASSDNKGD